MANTTTFLIVHCDEQDMIDQINLETEMDFKDCYDGEKCGGNRADYGCSVSSCCYNDNVLSGEKILKVINAFMKTPFTFEEKTVLIINSDSFDNEYGYSYARIPLVAPHA